MSPEDTDAAQRICLAVGGAQDELQTAVVELKQGLKMKDKPGDGAAFAKLAAAQ